MSARDFPSHAVNVPGFIVQLVPEMVGFIPNIIMFQYNPETVTRGIAPWNPFEQAGSSGGGAPAPDVSPVPPEETISFDLFLDALDPSQDYNPVNAIFGVAGRIAALKKLVKPTEGLLGDLLQSAQQLDHSPLGPPPRRQTVPIAFIVLGPGLMLPIRVTSLSFEQTLFTRALYPAQCKVGIEMKVLDPTLFHCRNLNEIEKLAVAAWKVNDFQEDALAVLNLANTAFDVAGLATG